MTVEEIGAEDCPKSLDIATGTFIGVCAFSAAGLELQAEALAAVQANCGPKARTDAMKDEVPSYPNIVLEALYRYPDKDGMAFSEIKSYLEENAKDPPVLSCPYEDIAVASLKTLCNDSLVEEVDGMRYRLCESQRHAMESLQGGPLDP